MVSRGAAMKVKLFTKRRKTLRNPRDNRTSVFGSGCRILDGFGRLWCDLQFIFPYDLFELLDRSVHKKHLFSLTMTSAFCSNVNIFSTLSECYATRPENIMILSRLKISSLKHKGTYWIEMYR